MDIVEALKNLPDDVKTKLASATDEQRKLFVDNLSSQIGTKKEKLVENVPKFGGSDIISKQGINPLSGVMGGDVIGTGLGLVEGVTAGIPRALAEKATRKDMSNLRGNALGQMAGFALLPGQIAGKAGEAVGAKVLKEVGTKGTRVAQSIAKGFIGKKMGDGILSGTISGGVSGIVGGFLSPQEDALNLGDRLKAATIGGVGGSVIGGATGGVSGFLKAISLNQSAKRVQEKLATIANRTSAQKVTSGDIYDLAGNPKTKGYKSQVLPFRQQNDSDITNLETAKQDLNNILATDTDQAIETAKKVLPQWNKAYQKSWGGQLDDLANDMAKNKETVKVQDWSDEISKILKDEGVAGNAPIAGGPTNSAERSLVKISKRLSKFKEGGGSMDSVVELKDILRDKEVVFNSARSRDELRIYHKLQKAVSNVLGKNGNEIYAQRLGKLNTDYAKFADIREFGDNIIEPYSAEAGKAQSLFQNYAKRKLNIADINLDRSKIKQLEKLEKEIGIPFLTKLRGYGDKYGVLENQVKSMQDKLSRTTEVFNAVNKRAEEVNRNVLEKIKAPISVVNQLKTAAYAYLLARVLGQVISRAD